MVAGSWHIENTERGFKNLRSQRNVSNNVPDEAVDSLLLAVKTTGVDLCKKYYRLKKGILKETQGLEEFTWADRNATIDIGTGSDSYSWEQAVQICKDGYEKFSPTMAKHFTDMVENKRIDVPRVDGKRVRVLFVLIWVRTVPIVKFHWNSKRCRYLGARKWTRRAFHSEL